MVPDRRQREEQRRRDREADGDEQHGQVDGDLAGARHTGRVDADQRLNAHTREP